MIFYLWSFCQLIVKIFSISRLKHLKYHLVYEKENLKKIIMKSNLKKKCKLKSQIMFSTGFKTLVN